MQLRLANTQQRGEKHLKRSSTYRCLLPPSSNVRETCLFGGDFLLIAGSPVSGRLALGPPPILPNCYSAIGIGVQFIQEQAT